MNEYQKWIPHPWISQNEGITSANAPIKQKSFIFIMADSCYSCGQKFTYTCEEHNVMALLSFQLFLQLWFFSDRVIGTDTSLSQKTFMKFGSFMTLLWVNRKSDQICWVKNIHTATRISNFGDLESCVSEMSFIAWPLNFLWVITIDYK